MEIVNKKKLIKLKMKNKGNVSLCNEIDKLIEDIEVNNWKTKEEVKSSRPDADQVHTDGFYFFNIHVHRTLILLELDDEGSADVVWVGTHDEYEATFKNNKSVISKWLRNKGLI
jgi:mRNA-degrading endonuclease HigB of HigAB toxin-antitoxin module